MYNTASGGLERAMGGTILPAYISSVENSEDTISLGRHN